jgi:hypothetical protein
MGYTVKSINDRSIIIAQFTAMMEDFGNADKHRKRLLLYRCIKFILREKWVFLGSDTKCLLTSIQKWLYKFGDETSMYYYDVFEMMK